MLKRVFIIHGYKGSSERGWKRWLADKLTTKGYDVYAPAMPVPHKPQKDDWVSVIRDLVGDPRTDDILVGHSLGTIAILRYLETVKNASVGKTVLVSSFGEAFKDDDLDDILTFVETPMDWPAVRAASKDFVIIHSDDDDVVPLPCGLDVARHLGVELKLMHGYGHFSYGDNVLELPEVLDTILV